MPSVLLLHAGGSLSPTARLAGAIVARALNDARLGDESAVMWFEDTGSGLDFWADVLRVRPEDLAERAARALGHRNSGSPRGAKPPSSQAPRANRDPVVTR